MEKSTCSQFPAFPTNVNELLMKLQEIQYTSMSKEEMVVLYANLNKVVIERKLYLQQEMDRLNDVREQINHMRDRLTLASEDDACFVPEWHECENKSDEFWNFYSAGVPFDVYNVLVNDMNGTRNVSRKTNLRVAHANNVLFALQNGANAGWVITYQRADGTTS
jgi:hypothetical protein